MAGKATIIIQGTAWGVRETQNGKRYLSVSVSPGYRDRNGNWVSQPEQYYSVWPAGYANLNPVFDQIAQLRQNQDQFVDVTIVGEISGLDAYTNKKGEPPRAATSTPAPSPSPTFGRRAADSLRVTARRAATRSRRRADTSSRSHRPPTRGPTAEATRSSDHVAPVSR